VAGTLRIRFQQPQIDRSSAFPGDYRAATGAAPGIQAGLPGFSWLLTAYILSGYTAQFAQLLPAGEWYREYLVCGGQIIFQGLLGAIFFRNKIWDYLGNMMTISLGGAILLLPVLAAGRLVGATPLYYLGAFLLVAGLMLLEHLRRCRLLNLGLWPSISWIVYRVLVLLILLHDML
jgi:hypothetical protein